MLQQTDAQESVAGELPGQETKEAAKLTIGPLDDPLEYEADRVAEEVLRDPAAGAGITAVPPRISSKCAACEEEESVQTKPVEPVGNTAGGDVPPLVHEVLRSPGQPLDVESRAYFEPRFGRDLDSVRVHTDARAGASAQQIRSLAYTLGTNIVFGPGRFAPSTSTGRRLIAHELAHVVQQRAGNTAVIRRAPPKDKSQGLPPPSIEVPKRVKYGGTPISEKASEWRRAHPETSGDMNLIMVEFSWSKRGTGEHAQHMTIPILNWPDVAHSEKVMDQAFIEFKKSNPGAQINVQRIFSERQFCGGDQGCHHYVMSKYPQAKKEFAYNYQSDDIPYFGKGETTKNVIRGRIEAFRDSGQQVDNSTDNDPDPYFYDVEDRMPGRVQKPLSGGPSSEQDQPAAKKAEEPAATTKPTEKSTQTQETSKSVAPKSTTGGPAKETKSTDQPATKKTKEPGKASKSESQSRGNAPSRRAPTKPSADKRTRGQSRTKSSESKSTSAGTGAKTSPAILPIAQRGISSSMNLLGSKLMKIAQENAKDPDIKRAIDDMNTILDIKGIIKDPSGFVKGVGKGEIIAGVFQHFSEKLAAEANKYYQRFPSVAELHRTPLSVATTLEEYRRQYEIARAGLSVQEQSLLKALTILAARFSQDGVLTEQERIGRTRALAETLARNNAGIAESREKYSRTQDLYMLALSMIQSDLEELRAKLAAEPRGYSDALRRRELALSITGGVFRDTADDLFPFVFLPVVEETIQDLWTLADGFEGLAGQLYSLARNVDSRKQDYDRDLMQVNAQLTSVMADRAKLNAGSVISQQSASGRPRK
jgi:hypothetical protein